ncbi:MAG: tetratricopeptide repeat protein [Gaiellaceae bacterium]
MQAVRGNGDPALTNAGVDGSVRSGQDPSTMIEPAALTLSAPADLVPPPVTDVFPDEELGVLETRVAGAETALRDKRYDDVVAILGETAILPGKYPNLALRSLLAGSWARMYRGELDEALALLTTAKQITHRTGFHDLDRAEVLCRIGAVRVKRGSISRAVNDLTLALELCNRSQRPSDHLRAEILDWRSRCYQRQRDFDAARADIEAALLLADSLGDVAAAADITFRAASIAEREGAFLIARCYAEKAKRLYELIGDRANVGRVLNDLGGITFLLGEHEEAIAFLKAAVSTLFDAAGDVETGYAVSSLAQVYLRTGHPELAAKQARIALELLSDREDVHEEVGNVQLVLGRALMLQGEQTEAGDWFAAAETTFGGRESPSLLAAAWMARGELALDVDDAAAAAHLYRRAAEALSDFHF